MTEAAHINPRTGLASNPKQAIPVLLALFVFSLIMDNGFKLMSPSIASSLGLSENTVSLQATLPGILIGIGAVVYAALSDSIAIRKLMIFAVIVMAIGSLIGFALQGSFGGVLAGRIIQTCGLAAAETLYVIWITKHFEGDEQKKYLGYSTAAFQLSLLLGAVGSGFIATYIGWTAFFLLNLV
ncbi:MAG: MFS transporter, partial [Mycobacteriaceae bacterium]